MQLECEQCGASIQERDLKLDKGIAVCGRCGSVRLLPGHFGKGEAVDNDRDESSRGQRQADSPVVPMPSRFDVENSPSELTIRWRWFHPAAIFLLFFAIAWDSFLVGWYSMVTSFMFEDDVPTAFAMVFILFPLAHVAVGIGVTYFALVGLFNSTQIRAGRGVLSVKNGPIPSRGNKEIPAHKIEQIYCQNKLKAVAQSGSPRPGGLYEVFAIVDNQKVKLVDWLRDGDEAKYIEQQLERFLKIKNREVSGES